jgi:hypothetical protein
MNIIVLLALAALMKQFGSPFKMAAAYVLFGIVVSLAGGHIALVDLIGGSLLWLAISFVYFYVLSRLEFTAWYWVVSIIGALVVNMA